MVLERKTEMPKLTPELVNMINIVDSLARNQNLNALMEELNTLYHHTTNDSKEENFYYHIRKVLSAMYEYDFNVKEKIDF